MRKLLFFMPLISVLMPHISNAQSLEPIDGVTLKCYYKFSFQRDSTDVNSIRENKTILLIGDTSSLFYSYGNYYMDSVIVANTNADANILRSLLRERPRYSHQWQIFKNYWNENITTVDYIMPDSYKYHEDIIFEWILTNDTKLFKGYNVQKATTYFGGRKWFAWFAPEIPISDGPYKFRGLPGLILHVEDSRQYFVFEIHAIIRPDPESEMIYRRNRRYIETTKQQFFAARERFRQDIIGGLLTSGMPVHEDTDLDRAQQNMLRRNNPIELIAE